MRQTLFFIPEQLGPLPLFGPLGWLSIAWVIFAGCLIGYIARREGWNAETRSYLPVAGIVWLAIAFVVPFLMEPGLGIPIRGYGVFLLLGVIAGVSLAAYRARQMGVDPELIFSLAFVMFVTAILGARAFYVIQYWKEFAEVVTPTGTRPATWGETLRDIVNVTKGGLVVYGSLIGGLIGGGWFLARRNMPVLATADMIAPSLLVGLALGRIGCLMNGCCFGGVCETDWIGPVWVGRITFPGEQATNPPVESPPYQQQREAGLLQGVTIGANEAGLPIVAAVAAGSTAEKAGLRANDAILAINDRPVLSPESAREALLAARTQITIERADGDAVTWKLPPRSLPVFPAQVYAAINAAILALLLWVAYPFRPRDGFILALLLTLYPLVRVLEEAIRTDEPGRFGTGLTISQLVSVGFLLLVVPLWIYIFRQPARLAYPPNTKLSPAVG
jgi:phosphatidylglycerol:prolipoprotein diacylglycerol transferase